MYTLDYFDNRPGIHQYIMIRSTLHRYIPDDHFFIIVRFPHPQPTNFGFWDAEAHRYESCLQVGEDDEIHQATQWAIANRYFDPLADLLVEKFPDVQWLTKLQKLLCSGQKVS